MNVEVESCSSPDSEGTEQIQPGDSRGHKRDVLVGGKLQEVNVDEAVGGVEHLYGDQLPAAAEPPSTRRYRPSCVGGLVTVVMYGHDNFQSETVCISHALMLLESCAG